MSKIKKCNPCSVYTLEDKCPKCGQETRSSLPPKYPDSYDNLKREERKKGYIEHKIY
jgi:rRNA maturation protein Nop10